MADRIKLLPEIVANQIKAGEVVERPSSAVKEMMENSIDAGATAVTVNFRNGGRDLIQIVDNGCGMSPTDARMAFERHATSKILTLDDVYALHTFGFRGEALASIAAVSQVELITRQHEQEIGTHTIINGGEFISQTPVATAVGSQFLVRNLFYNVPARRKFIDSRESTLTGDIKREFRRVALCHPEVEMSLLNNGTPIYTLPASNLAQRIVNVMGGSVNNKLLEIDVDTSIVRISGFIGKPSATRLRGGEQYMFVNGRFFISPTLNKAVTRAYDKLIPDGALPSFFIYFTVDPDRVDVNVHASKTEVKFAETDSIWDILHATVRETLAKTGAVPQLDFETERAIEIPVARRNAGIAYGPEPRATTRDDYNPFLSDTVSPAAGQQGEGDDTACAYGPMVNTGFDSSDSSDDFLIPSNSFGPADEEEDFELIESRGEGEQQYLDIASGTDAAARVMYIGQGYAAAAADGVLRIVDLSRARERILCDSYMTMLRTGVSASQQLLFPERLTVSNDEYAAMDEYATDFAALGFDFEFLGDCTVEVLGIPAETTAESIDRTIYDILQILALPQQIDEVRREQMAASLARSAAAHKRSWTQSEAETVVAQLLASPRAGLSPQGKPTMLELPPERIAALLT